MTAAATPTTSFREHHQQMRVLIGRIGELLDFDQVRRDPGAVATILGELFGKFSIHLALEDRLLYPKLRNWPMPHLSAIADGFEREMGGMKLEFDLFRRSWTGPSAIHRQPERFIAETRRVLNDLTQRISREDLHLYPPFEEATRKWEESICRSAPPQACPLQGDEHLAEAFRNAIRHGSIVPFYQPKYDLFRKRIIGFEALARWHDRSFGNVSPARFVPLAERLGLVSAMGEGVLRAACREAAAWAADGRALTVAVNVSPLQLTEGRRFTGAVAQCLAETGLPPDLLELEITEGVIMEPAFREVIEQVSDMGVAIAIDDFGTGYSSLAYLKHFKASTLKIDKSFVDDMPSSLDSCILLEAVIRLGHGLGMTVVAEGVETSEQTEALELAGCDLIQGYVVAPALSAREALQMLRTEDMEASWTSGLNASSPATAAKEPASAG